MNVPPSGKLSSSLGRQKVRQTRLSILHFPETSFKNILLYPNLLLSLVEQQSDTGKEICAYYQCHYQTSTHKINTKAKFTELPSVDTCSLCTPTAHPQAIILAWLPSKPKLWRENCYSWKLSGSNHAQVEG